MACAVLAMPCHVSSIMKFKGDSTELVDRLVEACNSVKVVSGKIVERELQPFTFEASPQPPKASTTVRSARSSPRCSPPKQHKVARKADTTSSRNSLEADAPNRTPKRIVPTRFVSLEGADDLARVLTAVGNNASFLDEAFLAPVKACPAFFSSPRPCEIPMPTSTLLVKANLVKAQ